MGDKKELDIVSLIKKARQNVEAEKKKEGKKTGIADTVSKTAKAIDIWTPTNVFRFSLAGLLTVVKLGLTSSIALVNVSWWLILLPAYAFEALLVAGLTAMGILAVLYMAIMALWTAFQILVIDPIQRRRFKNKVDEATVTDSPADDMLADIHRAMMRKDGQESH